MTSFVCIDNFLPYPNVVRSWALQQKYYTHKEMNAILNVHNNWQGKRTNVIHELDNQYADVILSRIQELCCRYFYLPEKQQIKSAFQITNKHDGNSWIHKDYDVRVAGILYLTPNPEPNSGTTFYDENEKVLDHIENVYNRLILYRSNINHKSTNYFGETKEDCRLTQVFFISEIT